MSLNIKP